MDCRSIVETPQLTCCETERYKTSIPTVLQMDLAKSRADNFRLIPANSAARDVLWVHGESLEIRACGIRTHERLSPLPVFKTGLPRINLYRPRQVSGGGAFQSPRSTSP